MLEALKNRRVWAAIFGLIALTLPHAGIDAGAIADAIVKVVEAVSALLTVILPLWSYFKPKK